MVVLKRMIIAAAVAVWIISGADLCSAADPQPVGRSAASTAQNPLPDSTKETTPVEAPPSDKLVAEQQQLADKYKNFEQIMLQLAELSAQSDPGRAALLKKALRQSKEELIGLQFERLVELLEKDQLSQALESQRELDQQLRRLLDMLLSENRAKRIKSEKARIREYLQRLGSVLRQEKDIQARTIGRDDPKRLAGEQGKTAAKTAELAKDIQTNEEGASGRPQPAEKKQNQGQEQNQPRNQPSDQPAEDQQFSPTRKRLEAAEKRMQEAKNKLEKAQQEGAAKDQEKAIEELEQAKAELEQILRQLREEEIERALAMLEARFRKMLEMQQVVYEGTLGLDKIPPAARTHNHDIESSRLSGKQMQIIVETDKAMLLLREDGTAVALPEAVDQMRADMQQVADRLAQAKVGQVTQSIELDIIASLEEIIEALKKAQKDQEKKRQLPNPPQMGECDSPLVDKLAELKMIRALQMRINNRTQRYSKLITGEQAENAELVDALKRLAERQQRVYRVTHDLSSGKTE
jgi:hypothetical protein